MKVSKILKYLIIIVAGICLYAFMKGYRLTSYRAANRIINDYDYGNIENYYEIGTGNERYYIYKTDGDYLLSVNVKRFFIFWYINGHSIASNKKKDLVINQYYTNSNDLLFGFINNKSIKHIKIINMDGTFLDCKIEENIFYVLMSSKVLKNIDKIICLDNENNIVLEEEW